MVFPYLKGLIVIKRFCILFLYICCGSFVFSLWFLTSGIRALSLADIVGKYFLFLQIFFFRRRKKRAATFQKFSVYFCEKFVETGCISEFLSEKHPSKKKKSSETESGKSRY
jgi:hypothetical protein